LPVFPGKGGAITGPQNRFPGIFDQRQLSFEHIDEFVFVRMPMSLARPVARGQVHEIDTEISKTARIAQPLPYTLGTGRVEWFRVAGPFDLRDSGDINLGHGELLDSGRPCFGSRVISLYYDAGMI
jgi:hypothetical protein